MWTNWQKLTQRRKFIVDWSFQSDVVFHAGVFSAFLLAVLSAGLLVPLFIELDSDTSGFSDAPGLLLYLHDHYWPVAALCFFLALLQALNLSHKIAGPMVRIRRNMRYVEAGVLPLPFTLRSRDFMKPEVEILNSMIESLTRRVDGMKDADLALCRSLEALEASVGIESMDEEDPQRRAFASLSDAAAKLSERIHEFRSEGSESGDAEASRRDIVEITSCVWPRVRG